MLQPMILVQNPFTLKIINVMDSSLSGIDCSITCQTPCLMQVFWGVSMEELDKMLCTSWLQLKEALLGNNLQEFRCLGKNQMIELDICENEVLKIVPTRAIMAADLGTLPRTRFPLVVLMMRKDLLLEEEDQQNSVVAMVTIVHIKDPVCTLNTSVIAQYLKQANEQTCCLKPLYMPTDSSSDQQQYANSVSGSTQTPAECVVCQINPISRVLLPCRHTCVCMTCFPRLTNCPMCRGVIQSYFCIRDEEPQIYPENHHEPSWSELSWHDRWSRFNDRLNQWLGFT
ncbi:cell growth regulator with RING finger domain protein 1-like isoform X2 [Limulus polyphemus]|nr:cell growth regulator with RING finger domain protein 1-like isoform X2 [Limulus polyphemus]XP_022246453.1 cell growth regulator with RING finger domain protein 1-like isoform X2 [Limulus polyphemus]XP_022246455.1 cell growth regulator with RING finger domain protein 1-like isoform X2 [Limulus polyphemus]